MTQLIDPNATESPASTEPHVTESPASTDLVAAVQDVLRASPEPLTLSKIRALLPGRFRTIALEELADTLSRQVAANVLFQYPKYRSQQDRFWDRPMPVHIAALLRSALQEGPLGWSELRRKLPAYAQTQAQAVLEEQLNQGTLHRHPRSGRGGERFGAAPADPKDYLRSELLDVFRRLEQLGFHQGQLRASALELLHEEEWSSVTGPASAPEQPSAAAGPANEATAQAPASAQPSAVPTETASPEPR